MRQPQRHTKSRIHTVPAPTGGWNARDALANMPENDCIILDNYFPTVRDVRIRPGYEEHASNLGGQVETIMPYTGPVTTKLLVAADMRIWDATAAGSGTALTTSSGFTNDRWQHTMFGTAAGNFLYMVNGADPAQYYDGTNFTVPSLTSGASASDLIHVNPYKQRLFFVEKDALNFHYLPVASVAGTLSEFDISPFCRLGGYTQALATWTLDAGDGPDDYFVALTSEGEAIVWTGTDPSSANTWSLTGVYRTAKPIGRRCFVKWGGELIIITEDGYMPMSGFLKGQGTQGAVSDKIRDAVTASVRSYKNNYGWQPIFLPHLNMMLFNVPTDSSGTTAEQHALNTITGAWGRFLDIDATCWGLYNSEAYFGGNGSVYRMGASILSDNNQSIDTDIKPAFNYMQINGQKNFNMIRPVLETDGTLLPAISMNIDFGDAEPTNITTVTNDADSYWDVSPWDTSSWGGVNKIQRNWYGASGIGYSGTLRMKASTKNVGYGIQAIDYMYEPGGYL